MLEGDSIETAVALQLILELLVEERRERRELLAAVAEIAERQRENPSAVWILRNKYKVAIPVAIAVILLIMAGSQYITPALVIGFIARLIAFVAKQAGVPL